MKDLIIIGAGPGGYELALKAAKKGLDVLLIEKSKLGGVCLQDGCIPTKTLYRVASVINESTKYESLGIKNNPLQIDYLKVLERKENVTKTLEEGIKFSLEKAKVELIYGEGKLLTSNKVSVDNKIYEGKYIVIATGSSPIMIPGFPEAIDSTALLNKNTIPEKLAIVGGGVIGIEMAGIFSALGSKVTVIEFMDRIIPLADKELSKRLLAYLKSQGIMFYLNSKAKAFADGKVLIDVKGEDVTISVDTVLVSVGRKPNVLNLGLEALGLNFTNKGISVNNNFQTNIPNIYAIGDVNAKMMLAHVATYQGYHVLNHILGEKNEIRFDIIPNCVFSFPELAWVGLTEEELESGTYSSYKSLYRANGKAHALNETDGFVKILVQNERIIGVHMIGYQATTLIQEMSSLMNLEITQSKFINIIHAHPTLNEIFSSCFH